MSPDERAAVSAIARLRGEMAGDREAMAARAEEISATLDDWQQPPSRTTLIVVAVALHGWYTGLETLLERAVRALDGDLPEGKRWHRALVSQAMTDIPAVRPAILPSTLAADLSALLSFRRFFRNAYTLDLDPDKLGPELRRLVRIEPAVTEALEQFDAFLSRTVEQLAGES